MCWMLWPLSSLTVTATPQEKYNDPIFVAMGPVVQKSTHFVPNHIGWGGWRGASFQTYTHQTARHHSCLDIMLPESLH